MHTATGTTPIRELRDGVQREALGYTGPSSPECRGSQVKALGYTGPSSPECRGSQVKAVGCTGPSSPECRPLRLKGPAVGGTRGTGAVLQSWPDDRVPATEAGGVGPSGGRHRK